MTKRVPWEERFEQLKAWKEKNGVQHCRVPQKEKPLGIWVMGQRTIYRQGRMTKERIEKLKDIGFEFKTMNYELRSKNSRQRDDLFMATFKEFKEFYEKYGHSRIPVSDGRLGRWAMSRRREFWQGKLSQDRIDLLSTIDFEWDLKPGRIPQDNKYKRAEEIQRHLEYLRAQACSMHSLPPTRL